VSWSAQIRLTSDLAAAQDDPAEAQHSVVEARHIIRECEAKMACHQAVIGSGGDIQEISLPSYGRSPVPCRGIGTSGSCHEP
jgi:hypothetical protein